MARGRRLALVAEEGAEAAVEIAMGAASRAAEILAGPAAACVRAEAKMEFGYAGAASHTAIRTRGRLAGRAFL